MYDVNDLTPAATNATRFGKHWRKKKRCGNREIIINKMCVFKSTLNVEWGNMHKFYEHSFGFFLKRCTHAFNHFWVVFGVRFIDFKLKQFVLFFLFSFELLWSISNCECTLRFELQTNNFKIGCLLKSSTEKKNNKLFKAKVHYSNTYDYEKIT